MTVSRVIRSRPHAGHRSVEFVTTPSDRPAHRFRSTADLAEFTGLVGLFAIFADAAIGHALLWENDPYWTYWITKAFLLFTVFGLGSAWLGIGIGRGAVVTAVHTIVLTVYYWSFSPIGLPSHPQWLDLEHTWLTGLPVHFSVIYLGYLASLWLWRRRERVRSADRGAEREEDQRDVGREARGALAGAVVIVVVGGGLASFAVGDFPGVTWFLVRLLITVPFLLAWWGLAGRDRISAVVGGVALGFLFATYGHFVGPSGLPDSPLRIASQAPPAATVEWLSYRDEWLKSLPVMLVVSIAVLLAAAWREGGDGVRMSEGFRRFVVAVAAAVVVVTVALGAIAFDHNASGILLR